MNIVKSFLLLLQFSNIRTWNINLDDWGLKVFRPNRSIDEAIKDYFSAKTRLLSVALYLRYPGHWQIYISDFLTDVLMKSDFMSFTINVGKPKNQRTNQVRPNNLWYVDSYEAFSQLLPKFENFAGNDVGNYMVVMNTATHLQMHEELQLIFEHALHLNIVNIVIAVYAKNFVFLLYTYDIFLPGQCRKVVPRLINKYRWGKFAETELFPYKFTNFQKCPLILYNRYAEPFFTYDLSRDGQHILNQRGIEAWLINTLAQHLNFNLQFYYNHSNFVGTVYANGTKTGPFLMLHQKSIDIIFGHYNYEERLRYFSATEGYVFSPLVIIYHEHRHAYYINKWLWRPFHPLVWWLINLIVILAMFIPCYLSHQKWSRTQKCIELTKFCSLHLTWLDVMGLALGQPRCLQLTNVSNHLVYIMWIFSFMIICNIYQGKLYDAFNRPTLPEAASFQQLYENNYTFLFRQVIDRSIVTSLNIPTKTNVQYLPYADDETIYIDMLQYPGNVATLTNYWQFQAYISKNRLYDEFNLVPQIVVMNQVCAFTGQQSYLNEPLTRVLRYLNVGGIINKWITDERVFDPANTLKNLKEFNANPKPIPLTLYKFRLIFFGLIMMFAVSLVIFVCEILLKL